MPVPLGSWAACSPLAPPDPPSVWLSSVHGGSLPASCFLSGLARGGHQRQVGGQQERGASVPPCHCSPQASAQPAPAQGAAAPCSDPPGCFQPSWVPTTAPSSAHITLQCPLQLLWGRCHLPAEPVTCAEWRVCPPGAKSHAGSVLNATEVPWPKKASFKGTQPEARAASHRKEVSGDRDSLSLCRGSPSICTHSRAPGVLEPGRA